MANRAERRSIYEKVKDLLEDADRKRDEVLEQYVVGEGTGPAFPKSWNDGYRAALEKIRDELDTEREEANENGT